MDIDQLLELKPSGLYCAKGGFYIDPLTPTPRAIITHAHADHARAGHQAVMATQQTLDIMALRYGPDFTQSKTSVAYGETTRIGGVNVSLHPAGHVLGSAQILIECEGYRLVISGDYKRTSDPTCRAFEPLRCNAFVSEATFGLPVFHHPPPVDEVAKLLASLNAFPERAHILGAYSLGKAQRMIALLRQCGWDRPIWLHGAMMKITEYYQQSGMNFGDLRPVAGVDRNATAGDIVLCPPAASRDVWARTFPDPVVALASGWMRIRGRVRQSRAQLPLIISDHADWDELCSTISETECSDLWITHGAEEGLLQWAKSRGLAARPLRLLGYEDDGSELEPAA